MAAMRSVGYHQARPHARVREADRSYVIELEVGDFRKSELSVEAVGPLLTVRGDQAPTPADEGQPFRLHERLEESFRLPDDADPEHIEVFHRHGTLELRVPRRPLVPRRLPIERVRSGLLGAHAEAV